NQINRLVAREMLQNAGHQVIEAHNGSEGVHLANMQTFDVILMDISMPELDGVEATRIVRGSKGPNRETPIIALTAHALPEDTRRFLAAGINEILLKPMSMFTLQRALARADHAPAHADTASSSISTVFADLLDQLGPEKAGQLLTVFRTEAEALVRRTASATWATEPEAARAQAVHKLAGSASVMGATNLRTCLQALEHNYTTGQDEFAQALLVNLAEIWAEAREEIDCLALLSPLNQGEMDLPGKGGEHQLTNPEVFYGKRE
ncbi:MAG: hybrid sensor histidine kinase/response regulator, partial [Rhodobacterales bacterium]